MNLSVDTVARLSFVAQLVFSMQLAKNKIFNQ